MTTLAETLRCRLDAICEQDENLLVSLHTDPDVRRFLGGVTSAATARRQLFHMLRNQARHGMSIVLRDSNEKIGIIDFGPHHDGEYVEISYMMQPRYWGKGLAEESLTAALQHMFDSGLPSVVAETQSANTASCRLLERLGFDKIRRLERFSAEQLLFIKHR